MLVLAAAVDVAAKHTPASAPTGWTGCSPPDGLRPATWSCRSLGTPALAAPAPQLTPATVAPEPTVAQPNDGADLLTRGTEAVGARRGTRPHRLHRPCG
ncbi:hypothetical protein ACFQ3Z_46195 [Streptomyces nogalater]